MAAAAAVTRRPAIETSAPLLEVVTELAAVRVRAHRGADVPRVRGQVSLEAFPSRVHVRAEVASVTRRVEFASVALEFVVVAIGLAAANLKQERSAGLHYIFEMTG